MFHTGEGKIKWIAFAVAVVIHVVVLIVNLPEFKSKIQQKKENVIVVKKYVPPPPKVERKFVKKREFTRKVPIPDPTPDEPEPIRLVEEMLSRKGLLICTIQLQTKIDIAFDWTSGSVDTIPSLHDREQRYRGLDLFLGQDRKGVDC